MLTVAVLWLAAHLMPPPAKPPPPKPPLAGIFPGERPRNVRPWTPPPATTTTTQEKR